MKIKSLLKLYKLSKNWNFVDDKHTNFGKLSIPEYDLEKLDIRMEDKEDPNPQGEFMPAMTQEDYDKWQLQKSGWQKFYDKLKDNG